MTHELSLKQFADLFNEYYNQIGCGNNPEGWIGSHKIEGTISVTEVDSDTDYVICGLNMTGLGSCGCPSGIEILIKKC